MRNWTVLTQVFDKIVSNSYRKPIVKSSQGYSENHIRLEPWEDVQAKFADISGDEGIKLRQVHYLPYFLKFGKKIVIFEGCRFAQPEKIVLDDDVRINVNTLFYGSGGIHVGRHCRIGPMCFVHSANHDIHSHRDKAYFEKGYLYKPTIIGDNTLISAKVSILPGAIIGTNCFVGAGAVVTSKVWPDNSQIKGLPARAMTSDNARDAQKLESQYIESPSIVLVAANKRYSEAAKLLVTSLGTPQIKVIQYGEQVPASAHTAIAFGPSGWQPDLERVSVWGFNYSQKILERTVNWEFLSSERKSISLTFPEKLTYSFSPAHDPGKSRLENAITLTSYYAYKRLRKTKHPLCVRDFIGWLILCLFSKEKGYNYSLYLDALKKIVINERYVCNSKQKNIAKRIKQRFRRNESLCEAILCAMESDTSFETNVKLIQELIKYKFKDSKKSIFLHEGFFKFGEKFQKGCIAHPELLFLLVNQRSCNQAESIDFLKALIDKIKNNELKKADLICYLGIVADLLGLSTLASEAFDKILSDEFYDPSSGCIRSAIGSVAYCYSPVLIGFLLHMDSIRANQGYLYGVENPNYEKKLPVVWYVFDDECHQHCKSDMQLYDLCFGKISNSFSDTPSDHLALINFHKQEISTSLLENWLLCLTLPHLSGPIEIEENYYEPYVFAFESLWLSLFRWIQNSRNESFIILKPFPYGAKAACSLRYDIDRNTSSEQVNTILSIQKLKLNANCASWYAIPETPYGIRLQKVLRRFLQEVGTHALNYLHSDMKPGVTFHSAPNSNYWRGVQTILELEKNDKNILYSEVLSTQCVFPRPVWVDTDNDDNGVSRQTKLWMTPLHFPLEGTTKDTTLEYFDILLGYFQQLIDLGGHAIIGSHPDLNQNLLIELIEREKITTKNLWFASCASVVERTKKILGYGNIRIFKSLDSETHGSFILSKHSLSEVRLLLFTPANELPEELCLQLNAYSPRHV